jgi:hypothetical protein
MENELKGKYSVLPSYVFEYDLSLKAIGLYAFMNSKPKDWGFSYSKLVSHLKDGEKSIRTAVKELEEAGLLVKKPIRNGKEFKGWDWILNPKNNK